jgi:two-component system chemotaxis response regulator CheB
VIVLGSSTGGPRRSPPSWGRRAPVLDGIALIVALHMPPVFTTIFAEHLRSIAGRPAREPAHGERILPGSVYVAPGAHASHHRTFGRASLPALLDDGAPVDFCRPPIDRLFQSAARVWGPATLALLMTGMGADGVSGGQSVTAGAAARCSPRMRRSSAVWGMPGAAMRAGLCSGLGDPLQLGAIVRSLVTGDRP